MLFNSYVFICVFLPIVVCCFFVIAKRYGRKPAQFWLVISSLFFYAWWDYRYLALLLLSILFNYKISCQISRKGMKKFWLVAGIAGDLCLLGWFKYAGFFADTFNALAGAAVIDVPHVILPLGISFFTFTQIAYLVDTYRGETITGDVVGFFEFVTIFPHLIAGPIISHRSMHPQFMAAHSYQLDYGNIAQGVVLFSLGLFKKVVLADSLAPWVGTIFSQAGPLDFVTAWVGALGYTLQLYFDFSGYSEMAIGLGLMLNLQFPTNFNAPYRATSIVDFWRRWHMTLGAWVKEYLYIPLGGNRQGEIKKMRNLFLSMLLVGFWHGAGWTFILWGGWHGLLLMINHQWRRLSISLPRGLAWAMTFLCVVMGWVVFRANDFVGAIAYLSAMVDIHSYGSVSLIHGEVAKCFRFVLAGMLLVLLVPTPLAMMKKFTPNKKWVAAAIILFVISLLKMNEYSEFLYFQF